MSRVSSNILTIKCDVNYCTNEQVNVQVGQVVSTDGDWGIVTFDITETDYDLCPDHANQFQDFLHGVLMRKPLAEEMQPDVDWHEHRC